MDSTFTALHRGGEGPPLLLIHGFMETWRSWELVLGTLECRHEVLAPTLPGHAGGPPLDGEVTGTLLAEALERVLDEAGFATAHIAGNSLGGHLALQLAARGRADSVVALAPAGGWAVGDAAPGKLFAVQRMMREQLGPLAPSAEAAVSTPEGRRRATRFTTVNYEHIPAELLAHQLRGVVACAGADALIDAALRGGWSLDAERITCPVRVVWGREDKLLPWPRAAARFRTDWLPHADWVELDDVGHTPQLDVPLETAQLILGVTTA